MKRRLPLTALAAACALLVTPAAPATADPRFHEYVALGDSWSADATVLGIDDTYAPTGCAQSSWNYPKQVAARLHVPVFRDATCGGATTAEMTAPQNVAGVPLFADGVNPAQFDRLTRTTDLVTVGIGGNDAGLGTAVLSCLNMLPAPLGTPCRTKFRSPGGKDLMSQRIAAVKSRITGVIAGIRQRSPKATVLVVDYLAGVAADRGCYPMVPIFDQDLTWIGARLRELNAMLATAAAESGAGFVDTYRGSVGHDICQPSGKRWVEGLAPVSSDPPGLAVPFHPNRLGADHQAATVLAELES
ncbi:MULTISPECIES: SGNH/GDSL hydrolase family protein [unclassified Streptomyces]|uniref:SGNH/GDSL hydrolase family protein n=1 Tax=unclassified Streptomyces TaxID=2593676 RepID=UPI0037FAD637